MGRWNDSYSRMAESSLAIDHISDRSIILHQIFDQRQETAASELARMQDELGPLLEARNELLRLHQSNRALLDILREPSQAHLMGLVDRALPSAGAQFRVWRYQQRELKVIVEDPDLDPIAYVRSLEAVPLFEQVRAELAPGDNRLEITLKVRV